MAQQYGLSTEQKKKSNVLPILYAIFMILLALIAMQVATQFIAYKLNYHSALGEFLFVYDNIMPIYAFYKVLTWEHIPHEVFDVATSYGYGIFIFPQLAVILGYYSLNQSKGNATLHGSARWATEKEIKTMGYFEGEGVYVGSYLKQKKEQLYLRHNGPEHILCFAPTRSGKGVGLILPTLSAWKGSGYVSKLILLLFYCVKILFYSIHVCFFGYTHSIKKNFSL